MRTWWLVLALSLGSCLLFHRASSPIACPAAGPLASDAGAHVQLDGKGWGSVGRPPYTIVIDNRIEARVLSEDDSPNAERALAKIDDQDGRGRPRSQCAGT